MIKELITRLKDFIILNSGEKIYPEEIEEFYTKVAPVKEMCVFTVSGVIEKYIMSPQELAESSG